MKKIKLAVLAALCMPLLAVKVQAADGVLLSEYIEGSGNNKALEIYNGSGSAVDLGDYSVQVFFNGAHSPGANIPVNGSLAGGRWITTPSSRAQCSLIACTAPIPIAHRITIRS